MKKYNNGTKYAFIRSLGGLDKTLGNTLKKLNSILYGVIEAKPYTFDWEEILPSYNEFRKEGRVDIDKFCLDHVLGYSLLNGFSLEDAKKEAMYLHLRAELIAMKAKGEIE